MFGYSVTVNGSFEMPLWICRGLKRSAPAIHESQVKKLRPFSAARLVEVPTFWVLVKSGNTIHTGYARTFAATRLRYSADIVKYYVYLFKKRYLHPGGVPFFPDLKQSFLQPKSSRKRARCSRAYSLRLVSRFRRAMY